MTAIPVITVDGPSGAGKGTISHLLADTLGWHFLDSGALYRVTGQACLIEGVSWDDHAAVSEIAATTIAIRMPTTPIPIATLE